MKTQNEKSFEGVLTTWSPSSEFVLEQVHEIPPAGGAIDPDTVKEKMVFPVGSIMTIQAKEVDLAYASKKGKKKKEERKPASDSERG